MRALMLGAVVLLAGCREPLGDPDYSSHVGLRPPDGGPALEFLRGTDPYIPGKDRLAIGLFYEGGASDRFPLDPEGECLRAPTRPLRCYFIFESAGALQYTQDTVSDRVEGLLSDRFTLTGTPFWGGGVIWDAPTDLSRWTTLAVALKSSDPSFARVTISMQSGTGEVLAFAVQATDYGYVADGEWHALRIPLGDFEGLDTARVRAPFLLGGMGNTAGHQLLVDEVYLTRE